jgi:phosphoribosyl 1,2-cyclic phosphodiesterase
MTLRFTFLGCGASPGVPRIDGLWGACDPANPKNRRRRCSMLVQRFGEAGQTDVLIDTGPDLREQMIGTGLAGLDGVLYTHDHADHTHGIDDLRILAYNRRKLIDVYFDAETEAILRPEESLPMLEDLDVWIVDALRYIHHPSHFSVEQALEWIERIKPRRAILTHLHMDLDYETLRGELPDGVEPAYDGMVIELPG